jgi:hypothetical protein
MSIDGHTGPQGVQGITGIQGPATGFTGPEGPAGPTGATILGELIDVTVTGASGPILVNINTVGTNPAISMSGTNLVIGSNAGSTIASGTGNVVIGDSANVSTSVSNSIALGVGSLATIDNAVFFPSSITQSDPGDKVVTYDSLTGRLALTNATGFTSNVYQSGFLGPGMNGGPSSPSTGVWGNDQETIFVHNLGGPPDAVQLMLKCLAAESEGYTMGQIIIQQASNGQTNEGWSIFTESATENTQLTVKMSGDRIEIINKTNGNEHQIEYNDWSLALRAIKF